jgi:hypothetical protein
MIDHWLKINEVDEFKRRIHSTIRDIYMNLQKKEQTPVLVGQELKWASLDSPIKAPRFENMIDKMRLRRFDMSNPPQKSIDIVNQSFDSMDYDSPRSNS